MKVCSVFSLESPQWGESNEYTQYTLFNIKKETTLNYPKSAANGFFLGTQERLWNSRGKRAIWSSTVCPWVWLWLISRQGQIWSLGILGLLGDHLYGKLLFTWLLLVKSLTVSFCDVLCPTRCLGWYLGLNWVSFWGFSYLFLCGQKWKLCCFGNYCSLRAQSWLKPSNNWADEVKWVSKAKVILWLWPKVTHQWQWQLAIVTKFHIEPPAVEEKCEQTV